MSGPALGAVRGSTNQKKKKKAIAASSSTPRTEKYCVHCKIEGHMKAKCWKLHPEMYPKKWKKGKTVAMAVGSNEPIVVDQVQRADPSLSLMAMPKNIALESQTESDERAELFVLKIKVKQEVISDIVDTGSQKNLTSEQLVQILGLATTPHPKPYPLGWIHKDTKL